MIDVHAHVLPFVDDGSKSMEETILLLKEEAKSGVTDIICTPHLRTKYRAHKDELEGVLQSVKIEAEKNGIDINLHLGRELYVSKHYKTNIDKYSTRMPNPKYVLIEYSFEDECEIIETVYELIGMGIIPVIAHPERYSYISVSDVEEIKNLGALIQVNAESVIGSVFSRSARFTKQLLAEGLVDFVASDIHFGRKNCLTKAYALVESKYSKEYADKIFNENAKILIKG